MTRSLGRYHHSLSPTAVDSSEFDSVLLPGSYSVGQQARRMIENLGQSTAEDRYVRFDLNTAHGLDCKLPGRASHT